MRIGFLIIALSLSATPLLAREKETMSWGKPGVSLETYRSDALTCGRQGYYVDISGTQAVAILKAASQRLEANDHEFALNSGVGDAPQMMGAPITSAQIIAATRPNQRFAEIRKLMEDTVATCLTQMGYKQFRLTPEQSQQLDGMAKGSTERHAYLHALGSNPTVLGRQQL